ncbi:MAG: hypothetical protein PHO26_00400 [Dehalococcoidia bacterium]|jgi:hypothetical protein|nr:hypothetical protein [Dehalococcoidia bacterium]MDD5493858.1 hypothetical protein [Dehalococcoidia bacterium]
MNWYSENIEKLKQLSTPYFVLFITAKVIGGVSVGVLLAYWLPVWTWWIFMVIAVIIAIPIYFKGKLFSK